MHSPYKGWYEVHPVNCSDRWQSLLQPIRSFIHLFVNSFHSFIYLFHSFIPITYSFHIFIHSINSFIHPIHSFHSSHAFIPITHSIHSMHLFQSLIPFTHSIHSFHSFKHSLSKHCTHFALKMLLVLSQNVSINVWGFFTFLSWFY